MNIKLFKTLFYCLLTFSISQTAYSSNYKVQEVHDLDALFKQSKEEQKVIMLEMSATYCGYCRTLEEEVINPMLLSGDYDHVIIRQMHIDNLHDIKLPNGKTITPPEYSSEKSVFVTPTILFLNHKNEEVAERILGINTVELFSSYVDEGIINGNKKIREQ